MITKVIISLLLLADLMMISCRILWGDERLGNGLSILEGDRKEDRIIVYCGESGLEACKSGIAVVPIYARQYDEHGHYAEYVEATKVNDNWVIVRTHLIKENRQNYWIISKNFKIDNLDCSKSNCDSILQNHLTGPMTREEFDSVLGKKQIGLNF